MVFHNKGLLGAGSSPGAPLTFDEEEGTKKKLRTLTSDPLSRDLGDPEFLDFKTKQFERAYPGKQKLDAAGRAIDSPPVVKDVELFKPRVKRDHLDFGEPVGEGEKAKNDFSDLLGAKRALSNTGLFKFDVTREPSNVAGRRFTDAVKAFQRNRGLKIDGLMNPEGPTVKALRGLLFPPGTASNVGQPIDLSRVAAQPVVAPMAGGQSKFGAPRAALGEAPTQKPTGGQPRSSAEKEVEMAGHIRPPKAPGGKGSGQSPIPPVSKIVEGILDKLPSIKPPEAAPVKPEEPAHIIVYPDGRQFLATDPDTGKPKISRGEKAFMDSNVEFARKNINNKLPPPAGGEADTDDGTVREESYVVVEKRGEDGKLGQWLLVDPKSGQPLRVPSRDPLVLTPEEVQKRGLSDRDTSRREGPGFDEFMQLMQEFGKQVMGQVLRKLFGSRGTGQ